MPKPVLRPAKPDRGDANGNMTSGDGRTLTWTPFNMPLAIAQGASTLTFTYDTEHGRIKQVAPDGTTLYINDTSAGLKSEKFIGASSTRWVNYVYAGGGIAAVVNVDSVAGTTTRYFHKDHLGSTAVITDESGNLVERLAYDAWGKRRNTNGTDDPTNSLTSLTTRGFTGHEHLQAVALVHMNGRVYDPLLGRFLSADPHIQDPLNTQSLNRYSYVLNNPLCYTDPNGYFLSGLFRSIGKILRNPIVATIVGVAVAWATGGITFVGGVMKISIEGAIVAGATSGLLTGGIKGAILGGIGGAATFGIGKLGLGFLGEAEFLGRAVLHGVAQGTLAEVQGGNFGSAFLSAGFASIGGSLIGKPSSVESLMAKTVASAVIGGTASVIGGGKFQNGAATGAFVYLFNHAGEAIAGTKINSNGGWQVAQTGTRANDASPGLAVLYRVVDGNELSSLVENDMRFTPAPSGIGVKYFWLDALTATAYGENIATYGRQWFTPPLHLTSATISTDLLKNNMLVTLSDIPHMGPVTELARFV